MQPEIFAATGSIQIENIDIFRTDLTSVLTAHSHVILDIAALTSCDLSFVQAIIAARHMALRDGKRFELAQPAGAALTEILARAGMAEAPVARNSPVAPAENTFWFEGTSQ